MLRTVTSCVGNMSLVPGVQDRGETLHYILASAAPRQGTGVPIVITTVWTQTLAVAIVCVRVSRLPSSIL